MTNYNIIDANLNSNLEDLISWLGRNQSTLRNDFIACHQDEYINYVLAVWNTQKGNEKDLRCL